MTENGVNDSGNNQVDENTGAPTSETTDQVNDRMFSQDDVDRIVQSRLEKYKKKYASVDLDEYNALKSEAEEREISSMKKREEFDQVLAKQKEKYSSEIDTLRAELTSLKVDGSVLNAASKGNAVNPDQVAQLLKSSVGLDELGRPVVFGNDGSVIYDEKTAEPLSIEKHVTDFLAANPHFVKSGPSGVPSSGQKGPNTRQELDPTSLDMNKPEDRERYKKWRQSQGF